MGELDNPKYISKRLTYSGNTGQFLPANVYLKPTNTYMNKLLKPIGSIFTFCVLVPALFGQATAPSDTSYWTRGGTSSLTFSSVSLSNWAAGGENSIALNSYVGLFANYNKDRTSWENTLDMGYGLLKQGDESFIKSDDKISLTTKYGYQLNRDVSNWYFSALLDFKSQFAEGLDETDSVISRFLAPGYLVVATGIDYKIREIFSASLAPLTGKFTFVTDDALSALGAYGVDPGATSRSEIGAFFRMRYVNEVITNVTYETRLELFTNYTESFGAIDVNWENIVLMKVNKYLSANFITQLIYDEDVKIGTDTNNDGTIDQESPEVQFKTVFGVGLTYLFGDKR